MLLWTVVFWISYIKWYKFYNNNLLVVLGSKQQGAGEKGGVETREPQTGGLSVNSCVVSLSLNSFTYFAEMSSYFSKKTNKRKVRKMS